MTEWQGEARHAKCRYGLLTEAWQIPVGSTDLEGTPTVLPICTFPLQEPCPPALKRQWGGSIDLKDCAVCAAFQEVQAMPLPAPSKQEKPTD